MAYEGPHPFPLPSGGTGASSFNINGPVISGTTTTSAMTSVTLNLQQFLVGNTSAAPTAKSFSVVQQVFTGAGTYTYTPTTGMVYCEVICLGAGGGGGGTTTTSAGQYSAAAGGGGGEYAVGVFSASTVGASQTVTIGTGGAGNSAAAGSNGTASSLGSLITANGGSAGLLGSASTTSVGGGGAGGTGGTGGSYRSKGYNGGQGYGIVAATYLFSGTGGNSQLGSGGIGRISSTNAGTNGAGYGAGGGGGAITASTSGNAGGNGTDGIVIVTEYVLS